LIVTFGFTPATAGAEDSRPAPPSSGTYGHAQIFNQPALSR
jgi:hypothetical protein